jgi:hypothetical protein
MFHKTRMPSPPLPSPPLPPPQHKNNNAKGGHLSSVNATIKATFVQEWFATSFSNRDLENAL